MKILRVINSMKPETGGPCQGIRNSIPVLEKLGIHNEVLSYDSPGEEFIGNEHFIIHPLGPSRGPYSYSPNLSKWLASNLKRFDTVIIHGLWQHHSYGTYTAIQKYCKSKVHRPKLFVMPHGMLDPYFQKAKSRRLKAIRNFFFWKLIEHKVVNGADGMLFTCQQELLLARETFTPYKPKSELNVSYGIAHPPSFCEDYKIEFYEKCGELAGKPFFLFLSRIHPKKGVDLLVNAYIRLRKENLNIPDLVIAGPGLETDFGESIRKSAAGHPIHFPGMLKGGAKWGAFYTCTAFVLPSHQENFGIAVVEALACQKAVLISDQVNIFREIENGKAGIVGKDSEKGIYELLKSWIDLPVKEQDQMSTNAYQVFHTNYTIEKAAKKLLKSLQISSQVISENKKTHDGIITHNI